MRLVFPKLPAASLVERNVWNRWLAFALRTPRWARTRSNWALSAGFAAGALHLLSLLILSGQLDALYEIGKMDLETLIGTCIGTVIVTLAFFVPLWCSAGFYCAFFKPRRLTAAIWCLSFHVLAHLGIIAMFESTWQAMLVNIHVPILVAGVWGLWLPGAEDEPRRDSLLGS
jgi:hypothetical protein